MPESNPYESPRNNVETGSNEGSEPTQEQLRYAGCMSLLAAAGAAFVSCTGAIVVNDRTGGLLESIGDYFVLPIMFVSAIAAWWAVYLKRTHAAGDRRVDETDPFSDVE